MKNTEMNYIVDGTSALRLPQEKNTCLSAHIIMFPSDTDRINHMKPAYHQSAETDVCRVRGVDTLEGLSLKRFTPAEAVVTFAISSLITLLALVLC